VTEPNLFTEANVAALCDSRIGDIRDTLMSEYDVDAETCERELDLLLGELEKDGLVELRPE